MKYVSLSMNSVYDRIDKILIELNKNNGGGIANLLMDGDGKEAKNLIIKHELATFMNDQIITSVVYIRDNGRDVIKAGGFENWLQPIKLKENLINALQFEKLVGEVDKLKLDLDFAIGAKKRAQWSIAIAIISIIVALIAIVISLLPYMKLKH